MFDDTQIILRFGIAAAKSGDIEQARNYLNRVLIRETSPEDRLEAMYWLSEIASDKEEEALYIEQILARDPADPRARRKWAILKGELNPDEIINPDKIKPSEPQLAQPVEAKRFTCPNCGGKMVYGADGKTLICEYCESSSQKKRLLNSVETGTTLEEHDFLQALATIRGHSTPVRMNTFSCKGCGVDFILPPNQLTITCPYCASAYVLEQQDSRELIAPDAVIPFQLDMEQIIDALRKWLKEDPPPPPIKVARGNGVFLPVWVFEVGGAMTWSCQMEISNRWLPRNGRESILSREVIVSATHHVTPNTSAMLKGYMVRRALPFEERYLVHHLAETFDISVSDASLDARKMVLDRESGRIEQQFNLPVRDLRFFSRGLSVESYRLVLVPVWVSFYLSDDQRYQLLVNGQTGAVMGERPAKGLQRLLDGFLG